MGTISTLRIDEGRAGARARGALRPATLRVTIDVGLPDDEPTAVASIHLHVSNAKAPIRLYLYVDGDLAEAWANTEAVYELRAGDLPDGRHAVTARAVDALGRWAGASTIVDLAAEHVLLAR